MEETVWYPSEWKCECPHCEATNTCSVPQKDLVCGECGKAFAASVAHTGVIYIGSNYDLQGRKRLQVST